MHAINLFIKYNNKNVVEPTAEWRIVTTTHEITSCNYEKSQTAVQTIECGNYWFPWNVLCSNLGYQTHDDENSVSVASAQQQAMARLFRKNS